MVYQCLNNIQNYLFPASCTLCQARIPSGQDFCDPCERSLPRVHTQCVICGAALPQAQGEFICGQCQRHPPAYTGTVHALAYRAPVAKLVLDLKYHGKLHLAPVLGRLLADAVNAAGAERPDIIVPVPLHRSRLRSRGYNQALEIARPVGKRLDIPVDPRLVRRTRDTGSQTDLPQKDRAKNVRGAFAVQGDVEGRSIAIVDDVMTTGYTADSVAEALMRAKAKSVSVWIVARA